MKQRSFVALTFFAMVFAACGGSSAPKGDAGVDGRPVDSSTPLDMTGIDRQAVDSAVDTGGADREPPAPDGPVPDTAPIDGAAPDLAPDRAPDVMATDLPPDSPPPDIARDSGPVVVMCGPAPRDMLCTTYCEGIGRVCSRGDTQYRNADECRAACLAPTWACGQPGDLSGNSLFCRLAHMALAGVGNAAAECPNAGPNSPACR